MGIGERLKQERELQNLSLEEIQKRTKIQTRYLDAIEQERFHIMPGSFYVRAFIKEYANVLHLNPEELMEEYSADLPFENEEKAVHSRVQSSKKNKPSFKTPAVFSFLPSIIVVLLIIGIVVLVWLFSQDYIGPEEGTEETPSNNDNSAGESVQLPPNQDQTDSDKENEKDTESTNDEQEEKEPEEQSTPDTEIQLDNYANKESQYTISTNEEEMKLTIKTENRNWLEIEDQDGESYYRATFTEEENPLEIDISDFSELYLRFGEPESIQISINDKPVTLSEDIQPTQIQEAWFTIEKEE